MQHHAMPCHATHRFDQVRRQVGEDEAGEDEEHHLGQPLLPLLQPFRQRHVRVTDLKLHLLPDTDDLEDNLFNFNNLGLILFRKFAT